MSRFGSRPMRPMRAAAAAAALAIVVPICVASVSHAHAGVAAAVNVFRAAGGAGTPLVSGIGERVPVPGAIGGDIHSD